MTELHLLACSVINIWNIIGESLEMSLALLKSQTEYNVKPGYYDIHPATTDFNMT